MSRRPKEQSDYWIVEGTRSSQCAYCVHQRVEDGQTVCDAFPGGVPAEILYNRHDHREPYPGDGGVRYRRAEWAEEQDMGPSTEKEA